jgi:hypothetical protein
MADQSAAPTSRRCQGVVGRLFGHLHQPRFTTKTESFGWVAKLGGSNFFRQDIPPDVEERIYHGDVCSRCGSVVNEQQPPAR